MLAAFTWIAIRIGARLFRVGLLMSGARQRFKEIIGNNVFPTAKGLTLSETPTMIG